MKVILVPILADNYAYLIISESGKAAVVDPADPDAVMKTVSENLLDLCMVLTTHRHWDHAGGNEKLAKLLPDISIIGGAGEKVPGETRTVSDGEELMLGDDVRIRVLSTPYHTSCHVCYYCEDVRVREDPSQAPPAPVLFSGDTLFVAGVGRCFSGNFPVMQETLARLAALPPETRVYCGHEYTVANLQFARTVGGDNPTMLASVNFTLEPDNPAIQQKLAWAKQQRSHHMTTIPSTIQEELEYNPFLRCSTPAVMAFTARTDPLQVLAELRRRKDTATPVAAAMTWTIKAIEVFHGMGHRLGLTRHGSFLS